MPETILGKRAVTLAFRQGYAKGIQQGMRKGLPHGIKAGRAKGGVDGMRHVILRQLTQRFRPTPATLQHRIERLTDARLIDRIARELLKTDDVTRLKKLVATGDRARKRRTRGFTTGPDGPAGAVNPRRPRRLAPVRYPH
jgi:hypothetical protein